MEHEERLKAALADRYEVEEEIGSGGMATVYLAQDLKHDRKVAVKVLRPELAALLGADRFLGEIKVTANLQHPHILPLFDSGEADGFLFYVMPFVEGESLQAKLYREKQLSVEDAVAIATSVANALDYAHRHGVIHRDIKPANILLHDSQPMVADFGIALAVSAAGGERLTETGLSLGTPFYMSPEQAAGDRDLDPRSDLYSLGCVLYEMLTGEPPHMGSTAQAVLAKILTEDPRPITQLRRTVPRNVEASAARAMERLPADRFETGDAFSGALLNNQFRHGEKTGIGARRGSREWLAMSLGALALLVTGVLVTLWMAPETPLPHVMRQEIKAPGDGTLSGWTQWVALAPDGSSMVFRDTVGLSSGWQLWLKDRGSAEGEPLPGTTNAREVVFSPDGLWIAYVIGTDLFKRRVRGPGATKLAGGVNNGYSGLNWLADGTILCILEGRVLVQIHEDAASAPDTVLQFDHSPIWFQGLPGERAALAVRCLEGACPAGSVLGLVDLETGVVSEVLNEVLRAWYVPTGHLVWVRRDGALFATPFDLERMTLSDQHIQLPEQVRATVRDADILVALDGTVLLVPGRGEEVIVEMVWVDREGQESELAGALRGRLYYPDLSPDGTRIAVEQITRDEWQVWVVDPQRGLQTKVTTAREGALPSWGPGEGNVTFYTKPDTGLWSLWRKRADGSGEAELVIPSDRNLIESVWSRDSDFLIFSTTGGDPGNGDILVWDVDQDSVRSLFGSVAREGSPALSPDGRWLAYVSDKSGEYQVYVSSFPNVREKETRVSLESGVEPFWAQSGQELFYRKWSSGDLIAVQVASLEPFEIGGQEVLFSGAPYRWGHYHPNYGVSPDGQRFVMLRRIDLEAPSQEARVIQILNWFTELEERVGREN